MDDPQKTPKKISKKAPKVKTAKKAASSSVKEASSSKTNPVAKEKTPMNGHERAFGWISFIALMVILLFLFFMFIPKAHSSEAIRPEAICRITVGNTCGTGVVFEQNQKHIYILTNAHVVDTTHNASCTFWCGGHESLPIAGQVILNTAAQGVDAAVIAVSTSNFETLPLCIPIAPQDTLLTEGQTIASAGCAKGSWPTLFRGHVIGATEAGEIRFSPAPMEGRSGSPLTDANGVKVVGLVRARTDSGEGLAVSLPQLYTAMQKTTKAINTASVYTPTQCGPNGCSRFSYQARRNAQQATPPASNLWPTMPAPSASVDLSETNNRLDKIAILLEQKTETPAPIPAPMPIPPEDDSGKKALEALTTLKADLPKVITEAVDPIKADLGSVKAVIAPLIRAHEKLEQDAEEGGLKGRIAQRILDKIEGNTADKGDALLHSNAARIIGTVLGLLFVGFILWQLASRLGKLVDVAQAGVTSITAKVAPQALPAVAAANASIDTVQAAIESQLAAIKAQQALYAAKIDKTSTVATAAAVTAEAALKTATETASGTGS